MKESSSLFSKVVLLVCVLWPLLFLGFHKVVQSYHFDNDFGRDLLDIQKITQGDITLLGPKLSFGGIHAGPYYYYLYAPLLAVTPGIPETLLYANVVLSWLALCLGGFVLLKVWKAPLWLTVLGTYWVCISTYFLYSARGPGNAFTYVPWLFPLILLWDVVWNKGKWWHKVAYGLAWGVALNFHLVTLIILCSLVCTWVVSSLWQNRKKLQINNKALRSTSLTAISVMLGAILAFTPVVLFDITHQFVQFTNTFVHQSNKAFTDNANLPNAPATSDNPVLNTYLLYQFMLPWLPSIGVLVIGLLAVLFIPTIRSSSSSKYVLGALLSTVLLILMANSQVAMHYFFPLAVLLQTTAILVLLQFSSPRWIAPFGITALLLISLWFFPYHLFQDSTRRIELFRASAQAVADSPLATILKNEPFSVYVTRETPLAPQGYEYRYFLSQHGLVSQAPDAYNQATYLLWFAENPTIDDTTTQSWELDQFGVRNRRNTVIQEPVSAWLYDHTASQSAE